MQLCDVLAPDCKKKMKIKTDVIAVSVLKLFKDTQKITITEIAHGRTNTLEAEANGADDTDRHINSWCVFQEMTSSRPDSTHAEQTQRKPVAARQPREIN